MTTVGISSTAAVDRRGVDGRRRAGRRSCAPTRSRGAPATEAAAAGREDARRAVEAAHAAFPAWARDAPGRAAAAALRGRRPLLERAPEIAGAMTEEVGATFGWGMFNCGLAAGMLREAAAQTYAVTRRGDPLRRARPAGHGGAPARRRRRRHRAVERAGHPRHARGRDAAGLRQHGRAQGVRAAARARTPPWPRRSRRRRAGRRDQPGHPTRPRTRPTSSRS